MRLVPVDRSLDEDKRLRGVYEIYHINKSYLQKTVSAVYIKKILILLTWPPGKKIHLSERQLIKITSFAASDTPQEVFSGNCHCTKKNS
jgi:hypothetical protein